MVRYTEVPDEPSKQGTEELALVTNILGQLE